MPNHSIPIDLGVVVTRLDSTERNVNNLTETVSHMAEQQRTAMADRDAKFHKEMVEQTASFNARIEQVQSNLTSELKRISSDVAAQLSAVFAKLEKGKEIPWPAYGLMLTAGAFLFALMYWPIQKEQSDLSAYNTNQDIRIERLIEAIAGENKERTTTVTALRDTLTAEYISRREFESLSARGKEERERTGRQFEALQADVFPKEVHEQRWARFDSDIAASNLRMDTHVQNIQREIDAIQRSLGDTYTARDALLENKNRIAELEKMIREIISRPQSKTYP